MTLKNSTGPSPKARAARASARERADAEAQRQSKRKVVRGEGTVINAPATAGAAGYAFVELDTGESVYCHREIVAKAGVTYEHVGDAVIVDYYALPDKRLAAHRLRLKPADGADPYELLAALEDVDAAVAEIDGLLDRIDDTVGRAQEVLRRKGLLDTF